MKIRILGSAAAECVPALWCECDICEQARKNGGKDLRRRTSYLIDEDTLVDMGPDFFAQVLEFKIDERKLKRIIFTHRHEDHMSPIELIWRRNGFSKVTKKIRLFGGRHVFTRILTVYAGLDVGSDYASEMNFEPVELHHGECVTDEDLLILPMNANHDPGHTPFVHIISRGGKKVFICNDSGALSEDSMKVCANANVDLLIIDGTMGLRYADHDQGHLGVNAVVRAVERFRKNGTVSAKTRLVVNHFSHNGNSLQADLEAFFTPHGIEVGYDGMSLEV